MRLSPILGNASKIGCWSICICYNVNLLIVKTPKMVVLIFFQYKGTQTFAECYDSKIFLPSKHWVFRDFDMENQNDLVTFYPKNFNHCLHKICFRPWPFLANKFLGHEIGKKLDLHSRLKYFSFNFN